MLDLSIQVALQMDAVRTMYETKPHFHYASGHSTPAAALDVDQPKSHDRGVAVCHTLCICISAL